MLHELVRRNLVQHVETRSKSSYRVNIISPVHAGDSKVSCLDAPLHPRPDVRGHGLRSSEILALRRSDILWGEGRIRISKRWAKGEDGETKTDASDGYVGPLRRSIRFLLAILARGSKRRHTQRQLISFSRPSGRKGGSRFTLPVS
jgi:integrase